MHGRNRRTRKKCVSMRCRVREASQPRHGWRFQECYRVVCRWISASSLSLLPHLFSSSFSLCLSPPSIALAVCSERGPSCSDPAVWDSEMDPSLLGAAPRKHSCCFSSSAHLRFSLHAPLLRSRSRKLRLSCPCHLLPTPIPDPAAWSSSSRSMFHSFQDETAPP